MSIISDIVKRLEAIEKQLGTESAPKKAPAKKKVPAKNK